MMWRRTCFRVSTAAGALLFAGALAGCGGTIVQQPQSPQQPFARSVLQIRNSAAHLYVSDAGAHVVLRFPMQSGIPASHPDAVISGFTLPRGIAIGADGRLYAVDKGAKELLIFAPSPGTNSKPVRTISIGHDGDLGTVAVDPSGNTYVAYGLKCTTEGFWCGYTDVYSPFADGSHFIKTIGFGGGPPGALIRSMTFDDSGRLVEGSGGQNPVVYFDVLNGGGQYPVFCGAASDSGNVWGAAANELIETDLGNPAPQIVVIPDYTKNSDTHCPPFYTITSSTIPLNFPFAMATNGKYIYVTNGFSNQLHSGVVLVFDPSIAGSQKPVAALHGAQSQLKFPIGIAIGP